MSCMLFRCFWVTCFALLAISVSAQNSKKVKTLKQQQVQLQKNLERSKSELNKTKQKVQTGQKDLSFIGLQLDNRLDYIRRLESDMDSLDTGIADLQSRLSDIEQELSEKKDKYVRALRYARRLQQQQHTLFFVLSAKNFMQMYLRARYTQKYVRYLRDLGRQVQRKQIEMLEVQNNLLQSKSQMNETVREVIVQRRILGEKQVRQQNVVENLKKQESGLAAQVEVQRKQLAALNKKIDDLIAQEIEQARKRAEEAARKAELAARNKEKKGKTKASTSKSVSGKTTSKSPQGPVKEPVKSSSQNWLTAADKQLSGSFERNKGRLPVPITGQYMLGNRFGVYAVPGLKNVRLDNKGTNFIGKPGARARSVFDGEVSAVFRFGETCNVLVRHGAYISVYCNLSSVIVNKGQKVKARDVLGTVMKDAEGNCVLHFQLRKETAKLNPEQWIAK